ncbi:hypothetical protein A9G11_10610 [Gilliamella sp. wkB108]|uniref:hypothetical protein n=1 Tax=Gilliamella sp. wkB108 TaxID=3120256 RepID=UPI00080EBEAE|nr:hypothetical protein [Gilliamella apicola]OCG28467.1 hypothetical protein A9G11_10610 [Gilliamella apicola]
MKKTLLSLALITLSATVFAAEPAHTQAGNASSEAAKTHHAKLDHQNNLLDITINSDNPEETIKKITSLFPYEKGKQYSLHVSITEFPAVKEEIQKTQPPTSAPTIPPVNTENKTPNQQ